MQMARDKDRQKKESHKMSRDNGRQKKVSHEISPDNDQKKDAFISNEMQLQNHSLSFIH